MNSLTGTTAYIIANGEMIHNQNQIPNFHKNALIIAADGGLNHCARLNIKPQIIIGDIDSASAIDLNTYEDVQVIQLDRAKAKTDLECAIDEVRRIDQFASIKIWGALGNRIDHSLFNLHLPAREPNRIFLETGFETIAAIDASVDTVLFESSSKPYLSICSFYGDFPKVHVDFDQEKLQVDLDHINFIRTFDLRKSSAFVKVHSGKILTIVHDHFDLKNVDEHSYLNFKLESGVLSMLNNINRGLLNNLNSISNTKSEKIYYIHSLVSNSYHSFSQGTTVSILPFYGSAQKVSCSGFKWDFNCYDLNENFMSLSNVTFAESVSVNVEQGIVLLIANEAIIDTAMLYLNDRSSTGHLSKNLT